MAVGVVDFLEPVQVQSKYRQWMSFALGAGNFGGEALFRKPPVIQTGQGLNHGEVTEKVRMTLFLGELAAKPFDENALRKRINLEKHDQSHQTKNTIDHVEPQEAIHAATYCRAKQSGKRDD